MDYEEKKFPWKLAISGVALFIALVIGLVNFPVVVIGTGDRGVVFSNTTGIQEKILGEGLHVRIPFVESVKTMSVQVQKTEITANAGSKDLQTVDSVIAVNWRLNPNRVNRIYQEIGDQNDVVERVLTPAVNEVVKAATAKFTAEQALTQRPALKDAIDKALSKRLKPYNIILNDVSIVDLKFDAGFNAAIERKAQAEQDALAEKNTLEKIKYQAQQKVETAKADAEAIKIKTEALAANPALTQYELVQAYKISAEKGQPIVPHTMLGANSNTLLNIGN